MIKDRATSQLKGHPLMPDQLRHGNTLQLRILRDAVCRECAEIEGVRRCEAGGRGADVSRARSAPRPPSAVYARAVSHPEVARISQRNAGQDDSHVRLLICGESVASSGERLVLLPRRELHALLCVVSEILQLAESRSEIVDSIQKKSGFSTVFNGLMAATAAATGDATALGFWTSRTGEANRKEQQSRDQRREWVSSTKDNATLRNLFDYAIRKEWLEFLLRELPRTPAGV
jgi:hypothetical protein